MRAKIRLYYNYYITKSPDWDSQTLGMWRGSRPVGHCPKFGSERPETGRQRRRIVSRDQRWAQWGEWGPSQRHNPFWTRGPASHWSMVASHWSLVTSHGPLIGHSLIANYLGVFSPRMLTDGFCLLWFPFPATAGSVSQIVVRRKTGK